MQYESEYYGVTELGDSLMHHGVKGQKHGTRRWQYEDGSLTPAGRIHYGVGEARNKAKTDKEPAKFSEWMKDQMKLGKSFSSVRLAAEGIKKDAQKVKDIFGGSKKTDELGRLSNDVADRTLAGDLVPIKKGKIDDVVNKYGTEEEKKALTADKLDKYTQDTYGLSNKDLNRLKNMSADEKQKMANDIKLAQQLMDKGHNPDGSLKDNNLKKLVKSIITHDRAKLDFDKFADTEKKKAFLETSNKVQELERLNDQYSNEFYGNKRLSEKYIVAEAKKQWNNANDYLHKSWGSFENFKNWHLYDDGDQGQAYETWMAKAHSDHNDKVAAAFKANEKATEEYARELAGKNYDKKISYQDNSGPSYTWDAKTKKMRKNSSRINSTYGHILQNKLDQRGWLDYK